MDSRGGEKRDGGIARERKGEGEERLERRLLRMTGSHRGRAMAQAKISELEQSCWLCNKAFNGQTASPWLPQGNTKSLFIVVCTDVSELSISLITLDTGTSILKLKNNPPRLRPSHATPSPPLPRSFPSARPLLGSSVKLQSESSVGHSHRYK